MGNPNEPRRLTLPRPQARRKDDHATGNAGRDGFSVLAAARPQPFRAMPYPEYTSPGEFDQPVGERDYRRFDSCD